MKLFDVYFRDNYLEFSSQGCSWHYQVFAASEQMAAIQVSMDFLDRRPGRVIQTETFQVKEAVIKSGEYGITCGVWFDLGDGVKRD
jgi:hypothetical protein